MKRYLYLSAVGIMIIILSSCSLLKKQPKAEKAEVSQEQLDKEAASDLKKREKAHYNMQTPEAKKMMKRTKKASKKLNRIRITR